jgi:hypothetical protein
MKIICAFCKKDIGRNMLHYVDCEALKNKDEEEK